MKKILSILFCLGTFLATKAQDRLPEPYNSGEVYLDAYLLCHKDYETEEDKEDNYHTDLREAIKKLNPIRDGDSSYYRICLLKIHCYHELEEYDKALEICKEGLNLPDRSKKHFFLQDLGWNYRDKEDYKASEKAYGQLIDEYPFYYPGYNGMISLYSQSEKHQKAYDLAKETVEKFPFKAKAHFQLAIMALHENHLTEFFLAANMAATLDPGGSIGQSSLILLNEVAHNTKVDVEDKEGFDLESDEYDDLDLLIENYVAIGKKYKVKTKSDIHATKQSHLIFTELSKKPISDYFFSKTYVPIYKKIMDNGFFDDMQTLQLLSSQRQDHIKIVKKSLKDLKEFNAWFTGEWHDMHNKTTINYNGWKGEYNVWFTTDGNYEAFGELTGKNETTGKFMYLHKSNGWVSAIGNLVDDNKEGKWVRFNEAGHKSEETFHKNNELRDTAKVYFDDGTLSRLLVFTEEGLNGIYQEHYKDGTLKVELYYKNSKKHGPYKSYFKNGDLEFEGEYNEGKLTGTLKEYYPQGKLYEEKNYTEAGANGKFTRYYVNGEIVAKGTYLEGQLNGPYVSYYNNKQVEDQGEYLEGKRVGEWKTYYKTGELESIANYDERGKLNGEFTAFDYDGILNYKNGFKNGDITNYTFYDKEGNVLSEGNRKESKFMVESYSADGILIHKGEYLYQTGKDGKWKSYDKYGQLILEVNYNEGQKEGKQTEYFPWGDIETISHFKDGRSDGYFVEYYKNGQIYQQGYHKEGRLDGLWEVYYPDGTIKTQNFYQKGRNGSCYGYTVSGKLEFKDLYDHGINVAAEHYDTLGNIISTCSLPNGTGTYKNKHFGQQPKFAGEYVNWEANGKFNWQFPQGQTEVEGQYVMDKKEGKWTWYYANGKVETEGVYLYGDKDGVWTDFYENGNKKEVDQYSFGDLNGTTTRYYESGKVDYTINYTYGNKNGEQKFIAESGEHQLTRVYFHGKLKSWYYTDANGNKVSSDIDNGTATIVAKYPNGKTSREMSFKNGYFSGPYKEYNNKGQLTYETNYKYNSKHGEEKTYYNNGKLKLVETYEYGYLQGEAKEYHSNGKLKKVTHYLNGEKHGAEIEYDVNGNIKEQRFYYDDELYLDK